MLAAILAIAMAWSMMWATILLVRRGDRGDLVIWIEVMLTMVLLLILVAWIL